MRRYRTLAKEVTVEQTVERSRFLAHARPVASREEAEAFLAHIREEYADATHNVPAMVLGEHSEIQWASDDGEPQGTSGAPMVQLLVKEDLTNVVIVVTRYFGGVKLGTGGLVRAYTGAAQKAIEAAGIREVRERFRRRVSIEYTHLGPVEHALGERGYTVEDKVFAERVSLVITADREKEEDLLELLSGLTKGGALWEESTTYMG